MGLFGKKTLPQAWVEVCGIADFRTSKCFEHGGKEYALFRLEDGIFCTMNSCSHEYSPLCEGEIMDGEVYCPKHGSRFDIRTGEVRSFPATENVATFPVEIRGERVWVFI